MDLKYPRNRKGEEKLTQTCQKPSIKPISTFQASPSQTWLTHAHPAYADLKKRGRTRKVTEPLPVPISTKRNRHPSCQQEGKQRQDTVGDAVEKPHQQSRYRYSSRSGVCNADSEKSHQFSPRRKTGQNERHKHNDKEDNEKHHDSFAFHLTTLTNPFSAHAPFSRMHYPKKRKSAVQRILISDF
jgi:hypothetical protein